MKRVLALIAGVALLMGLAPMTVLATHGDGTGGVSATVTPAFVSVTVTEQHVAYGTVDLGVADAQPTDQDGNTDAKAAFKVSNNGTKDANWAIEGGASSNWAIAATPGNNQYAQFYDDEANTGGDLVSETSLDGSSSLAAAVTPGSDVFVWLELDMPTDSSTSAEESLPILITATAS